MVTGFLRFISLNKKPFVSLTALVYIVASSRIKMGLIVTFTKVTSKCFLTWGLNPLQCFSELKMMLFCNAASAFGAESVNRSKIKKREAQQQPPDKNLWSGDGFRFLLFFNNQNHTATDEGFHSRSPDALCPLLKSVSSGFPSSRSHWFSPSLLTFVHRRTWDEDFRSL